MRPANPSAVNSPESEPPFLSVHTTVVLLAALVIGIAIGALTALTHVPITAAAIAGLTAAGASIPVIDDVLRGMQIRTPSLLCSNRPRTATC